MNTIFVNGEKQTLDVTTIQELIVDMQLEGKKIAVALNTQFIAKADYESTRLTDGDKVDVVVAVQGG